MPRVVIPLTEKRERGQTLRAMSRYSILVKLDKPPVHNKYSKGFLRPFQNTKSFVPDALYVQIYFLFGTCSEIYISFISRLAMDMHTCTFLYCMYSIFNLRDYSFVLCIRLLRCKIIIKIYVVLLK